MTEFFPDTTDVVVVDVSTEVIQTIEVVEVVLESPQVTVEANTEMIVVESAPVVAPHRPQQRLVDVVSSIEAYIGYSSPGAVPADEAWSITKITDSIDGIHVTWGKDLQGRTGSLSWDSRLTYEYE